MEAELEYLYNKGKALNKTGEELEAWVESTLEKHHEREERKKDREAKRQAEQTKLQAEEKEKALDLQKLKIQTEAEEKQRAIELERLKIEAELNKLRIQAETNKITIEAEKATELEKVKIQQELAPNSQINSDSTTVKQEQTTNHKHIELEKVPVYVANMNDRNISLAHGYNKKRPLLRSNPYQAPQQTNRETRCYRCNQVGHIQRNCPQNTNYGNNNANYIYNGPRDNRNNTHIAFIAALTKTSRLNTFQAKINNTPANAMRDTGCSTVAVRNTFVRPQDYTGRTQRIQSFGGAIHT